LPPICTKCQKLVQALVQAKRWRDRCPWPAPARNFRFRPGANPAGLYWSTVFRALRLAA